MSISPSVGRLRFHFLFMPFIWPYFPPFSDALPAEPPTLPLTISKKTAKALCLSFERRILLPLAMAIARPNDKILGHLADYERRDHPLYPWRVSSYLRRSFFLKGEEMIYLI